MKPKVVLDKHLDPDAFGEVAGRFAMSAATHKPQSRYRGSHPEDEDYFDVLQLAWENEAPLLTRDGAMIGKAIQFRRDLPAIGEERCLRGVLVLPLHKADQIAVLRDFLAGKLENYPEPGWHLDSEIDGGRRERQLWHRFTAIATESDRVMRLRVGTGLAS